MPEKQRKTTVISRKRPERQGYAVVMSKELNDSLRDLIKHGRRGTAMKARAAIAEAQTEGEIKSIPRTKHGESRLPGAEKYDLGDGYRLVVQLLDGKTQKRAFLFAGTHEEAEHWLNQKRGYQYVENRTGMVAQVRVTDIARSPSLPYVDPDLVSPAFVAKEPILAALSDIDWQRLQSACQVSDDAIAIARSITREAYEADQEAILEQLDRVAGYDTSWLLLDLMSHAHNREFRELHLRIDLACGAAKPLSTSEAATSLASPVNSEQFVSFEDLQGFPQETDWEDWMLFLHPTQKQLADKTFAGPARLRGVAGSGKTCVLLHRARTLAKRYREHVLVITLTESMRLLLESLLNHLCGIERPYIHVKTMASLAWEVIAKTSGPIGHRSLDAASRQYIAEQCVKMVSADPAFSDSVLSSRRDDLYHVVIDELCFLRNRLPSSEWSEYVESGFRRTGQSTRIDDSGRALVVKAARLWLRMLEERKCFDHEAVIDRSLRSLLDYRGSFKYRCILVDEVQDLSQLELRLLSLLPTPGGELITGVADGLFLVGDGAQTVYKKGFSLKSLDIDIVGRSFVLKKNYRNTREVLAAAHRLVSGFRFADIDEDNVQPPVLPDYATARGERPKLVRCRSSESEMDFVRCTVQGLIQAGVPASQICVIGLNPRTRTRVMEMLSKAGERVAELRESPSSVGEHVKVSTIESAKGHEFIAVVICGLIEGEMPRRGIAIDEVYREAARLYVAMTRAREKLYLSYVLDSRSMPSHLLVGIGDECDEMEFDGDRLVTLG